MKTCEECGKDYKPNKYSAAAQRFCHDACSNKWWSRTTRSKAPLKKCGVCGKEYPAYKSKKDCDSKYCSQKCSGRAAGELRRKLKHCVVCGMQIEAGKYCSDKCRREIRECVVCGVAFETNSLSLGKMCGLRECELEYKRARARECGIKNHIENVKPVQCAECDVLFTPLYGSKKRVFCSNKCAKKKFRRIDKAVRRARRRGGGHENVDPLMILDRDKWKCQNCNIKTPKILRGTTEDNAPEVDHIIPLAAGGKHVSYNLQCLCRKCNQAKGDTIEGQLILFAGGDYHANA